MSSIESIVEGAPIEVNISGAQGPAGFVAQVKSASFTAVNGYVYHVTATATITDPTSVEGKGYYVLVMGGTVTVGGEAFGVAGTWVYRVYTGGTWYTYVGNRDLPEVKSANFTAALGGVYTAVATLTVTDPATPVEGQGFDVLVRNGTVTVGGTAYTEVGTLIKRVYHSGAYLNLVFVDLDSIVITTSTATDITGILKGDGSNVAAAVADTDYQGVLAEGAFADGDKTKLDGIESGATADQSAAEIKTAYESNADTNAFTDADHSKLDGIESGADVTDATNVDAAGAVMESDLVSDGDATPNTALKTDANGDLTVSDLTAKAGTLTTGDATTIGTLNIQSGAGGSTNLRGEEIGAGLANINLPAASGTLALTSELDGSIHADDIDFAGSADIGAALADADEVLVSDGGGNTTRRKSALSRFWTYIKAKIESVGLSTLEVTGDLTVDTTTLHVDSTNNRVGIGTTSPTSILDVKGADVATANNGMFRLVSSDSAAINKGGSFGFGGSYTGTTQTYWAGISGRKESAVSGEWGGYLQLSTREHGAQTTEKMRITGDGKVGIGTTSPSTMLQIGATGALSFTANSGTWNGATFAGDQTFSGQVELTGQAASSDDSAINRSLGDARYGYEISDYLASATTVNNSTTLADTGLEVTLDAGAHYKIEAFLHLENAVTTAAGYKVALDYSGALVGFHDQLQTHCVRNDDVTLTDNLDIGTNEEMAISNQATSTVHIRGSVQTNTAGTFKIQFAQNSAHASDSKVQTSSYIIARKLG